MHYILNTNFSNNRQDHEHMLSAQKAAAYYHRKLKIDLIEPGAEVFLYQSGVGIVAFGEADGRLVICAHEGDPGEEHHMKLRHFKYVSPALKAAQIKEVTGINHRFLSAMFSVDAESGKKIRNFIRDHALAKD